MEDADFARRLQALGRTTCLPGPVTTTGSVWRAAGVPRTVLTWAVRAAAGAASRPFPRSSRP
jgi:hypothetical protein